MTMPAGSREHTIADYVAVIRRYKWVIIVAALVVPTVAYVVSAREAKVFRATADVLADPAGPREHDHRASYAKAR
jgi:uncharacterized protein involved in exopolysaccharide biosynthesis